MIIVTGATGFIGSHLIEKLNSLHFNRIVAVDQKGHIDSLRNLNDKILVDKLDKDSLLSWIDHHFESIEFVFHLGARSDTMETDQNLLWDLNVRYSQMLWQKCVDYQLPIIYASSAATYGDGSYGFSDSHELIPKLKPLNLYGMSKQAFDIWALSQAKQPFFWAGLKFFNVYGRNEDHKGKMASMIYQMDQQITRYGKVKLFKSYHPDYGHGDQKRDFISVDEVTEKMIKLMYARKPSGIYNIGTGQARSFNDMAMMLFEKHRIAPRIEYIDMPHGIREKYQYFTEADMKKYDQITN